MFIDFGDSGQYGPQAYDLLPTQDFKILVLALIVFLTGRVVYKVWQYVREHNGH